jgi:hypothetical protein
MAVEVNIQRSGRAVLVEVTGELDIEGAAALSAAPDADVDLVILDARRLTFIDSSGLATIVALYQQLREENRDPPPLREARVDDATYPAYHRPRHGHPGRRQARDESGRRQLTRLPRLGDSGLYGGWTS